MIGTHFQHDLIRKYVSIFGTLFNDVRIARSDGENEKEQYFTVPISYGPREKYWAMIKQKPDGKQKSIQLPRMSFEITGMNYDPTERGVSRTKRRGAEHNVIGYPSPWDINFQLNIMAKTEQDVFAIIEQVLMYFQPDYTVTVRALADVFDIDTDIPIVYGSTSHVDAYEGDFITRRVLTWQIDFTMKAWLYGPTAPRKVIKHIEVNTHLGPLGSKPQERLTIQPGLTEEGEPTTDIDEAIPFAEVEESDNWAYIITYDDVNE